MTTTGNNGAQMAAVPPLLRDSKGRIDVDSVPDVIQWFLDYDQRVAIIKHPRVEEIFQWKQELSRVEGEAVFSFNRAEDRLAIGIIQALADNTNERALHGWISQLLQALDAASGANESTAKAYQLDLQAPSMVKEADKIPARQSRRDFILNCWVETMCTAEARVLGWLYKEFYGKPYEP
ncbi:MAG TPA: hypothetical protein VJS64_19425 [Pyrinomonadaceae bacterium]|nr:hypothetical protein [Pyrinomonadaceae bacterium]